MLLLSATRLSCAILRHENLVMSEAGLQVPQGEVKLTPFLFDLADPTPFTCDNPFKNHLFFWRYLGETKQR